MNIRFAVTNLFMTPFIIRQSEQIVDLLEQIEDLRDDVKAAKGRGIGPCFSEVASPMDPAVAEAISGEVREKAVQRMSRVLSREAFDVLCDTFEYIPSRSRDVPIGMVAMDDVVESYHCEITIPAVKYRFNSMPLGIMAGRRRRG